MIGTSTALLAGGAGSFAAFGAAWEVPFLVGAVLAGVLVETPFCSGFAVAAGVAAEYPLMDPFNDDREAVEGELAGGARAGGGVLFTADRLVFDEALETVDVSAPFFFFCCFFLPAVPVFSQSPSALSAPPKCRLLQFSQYSQNELMHDLPAQKALMVRSTSSSKLCRARTMSLRLTLWTTSRTLATFSSMTCFSFLAADILGFRCTSTLNFCQDETEKEIHERCSRNL